MAKEPNKKPDDKDDVLDDGLEEIDIDDLLMEDDTPVEQASTAPPAGGEGEGGGASDIVDDGEIDLLADDFTEPSEPALAEDVLELEEESPADAGRQTVLDSGGGGGTESPSNGNPSVLDDDIPPGMKDEEDVVFDLLAEDDEAAAGLPEDVPAGASEPVSDMDLAGEFPAPAEDETAPLEGDVEEAEPAAAAPPAGKKKLGKLGGGKPLKLGKKGKKGKDEEPEAASEKKPKAAKEKKAKPAREKAPREKPVAIPAGVRGSITFVCSECYEEFLIPSSYSQVTVSCPECLHVGKRPDDDFLRAVHLHKAGEKRSFLSAVAVGAVLLALVLALLWMHTPYGASEAGSDGTMSMVLLGAAGLLTVILIWLVVRFEGNRWEVYF